MRSTEDNYKLAENDNEQVEDNDYYARKQNHQRSLILSQSMFATVRKALDYSYHSVYTVERQAFQDSLVQSILNKHDHYLIDQEQQQHCEQMLRLEKETSQCESLLNHHHHHHNRQYSSAATAVTNQKPTTRTTTTLTLTPQWIVFTAGVMGAGKTFTLEWLHRQGHFPLNDYVVVDPDQIRRSFPEFHQYLHHNAKMAGERTRKEASLLTELTTTAALTQGRSVIVDGTLRDAPWYQNYFEQLRKSHPGIRIAILHITAPREAVLERAKVKDKKKSSFRFHDLSNYTHSKMVHSLFVKPLLSSSSFLSYLNVVAQRRIEPR